MYNENFSNIAKNEYIKGRADINDFLNKKLKDEIYQSVGEERINTEQVVNYEQKSTPSSNRNWKVNIMIYIQNKQKDKTATDELLEYDCNARYKRIIEGMRSISKTINQKFAIESAKRRLGGKPQTKKQRNKRKTKHKKHHNKRKKRNKNTRKTK